MSVSPDITSLSQLKNQICPTVDSEREEFRKYLESSGILDVLTRILKDLYEKEEKPDDLLNYFTNAVRAVNYETLEVSTLEDEIKELKENIRDLKKENIILREKLDEMLST